MREILFRGKTEKGEWVFGDLSCMAQRIYISKFTIDNTYKDGAENTHLYDCFLVLPETVGQFTGLTDKNGKKIFEGDIVRNEYLEGKYQYFKVCYDSVIGCWIAIKKAESNFIYNLIGKIEIIGNIHDNPELLEAQK